MSEVNLEFIAQQLANLIDEQRSMRDEMRAFRTQISTLRDEVGLLRDEVRVHGNLLHRLDDTIRMNVMDRLQSLEARR